MSKIAVELNLGTLPSYNRQIQPYTSSALGLGPTMMQNNGGTNLTQWAGPLSPQVIRPFEYTTATVAALPWAMTWQSSSMDWIFFGDNLTAAATRKVMYTTLNRSNGSWGINGIITVTFPVATNVTVRGFAMEYFPITTGSITIYSGSNTVTGYNVNFQTQGACVGNRIGFGTTVPSLVSQWYEITGSLIQAYTSSIFPGSITLINTGSLVLSTPVSNTYSASSYIIEDLRCVMCTTNATVANGGVFVVKGLRPEVFNSLGTVAAAIPAATTFDGARACYWLADASAVTNQATFGHSFDNNNYSPYTSTTHSLWIIDTVANPVLFNYNTRRPLALTAGKDSGSLILKTSTGGAPSGTPSAADNLVLATMASGPGSGSACLYFTTTTKIYRTAAVGTIISGSSTWLSGGDIMSEIPPGGINTFGASSLMNTIEYSPLMDKLIVGVNATAAPFRSYITQYRTDAGQIDRVWGIDTRQIDDANADSTLSPCPSYTGTNWSPNSNNGITYLGSTNTGAGSAILTRQYAVALAADWEYAATTGARIYTPVVSTPNCNKFVRFYVNSLGTAITSFGGATGHNLAMSCEDYRCYYRTAGTSDDSGTWNLIDKSGDLTGVGAASQIQFMFEFRTIGTTMIPDKILTCAVVYQDTATDSHYQPSVGQTNLSTKTFAWRFANAWGSTVPTLQVTLYDAVSGGVYLTDNTATPTGTWNKSYNDGSTTGSYDPVDLTNTGSYIYYTPASLGDNIKVQANLTQY